MKKTFLMALVTVSLHAQAQKFQVGLKVGEPVISVDNGGEIPTQCENGVRPASIPGH